jgi:hypothetical protein
MQAANNAEQEFLVCNVFLFCSGKIGAGEKISPTSTIYGAGLPGLRSELRQPNRVKLNSYTAKPPAKPQRLKA